MPGGSAMVSTRSLLPIWIALLAVPAGGADAQPGAAPEWYPLEVGRQWTYEIRKQRSWADEMSIAPRPGRDEELVGSAVRRVAGTSPRFPWLAPVYRVVEEVQEKNPRLGTTRRAELIQLLSRDGPRTLLLAHRVIRPDEAFSAWRDAPEPIVLLDPQAPDGEGAAFDDLPPMANATARSSRLEQELEPEPVETPAGTFEGCLRVVVQTDFEIRGEPGDPWDAHTEAVSTSWYADGVGLVRKTTDIVVWKRVGELPPGFYDQPGERDWRDELQHAEFEVSRESATRTLTSYEVP